MKAKLIEYWIAKTIVKQARLAVSGVNSVYPAYDCGAPLRPLRVFFAWRWELTAEGAEDAEDCTLASLEGLTSVANYSERNFKIIIERNQISALACFD